MKLRPFKNVHTAVAAGATASLMGHFGSRLYTRCELAPGEVVASQSAQVMSASKAVSELLVGPVELGYVSIALRQEEGFELPRLRLRAHKVAMTDEGLQQGLATLEAVLQRKELFTILWDVRTVSLPTRAQLLKGTAWANAHREELDTYLAGIGVLQSSRIVRAITNFVIRLTKPPQPICITMDEKCVDEFARPISRAPDHSPSVSRKQAACAAAATSGNEAAWGVAVGVATVVLVAMAAARGGGAASSGGGGNGRTGGPLDGA